MKRRVALTEYTELTERLFTMKNTEVGVKVRSGGSVSGAGATGRSGNMTGKCKLACICPAIYRSTHPDSSGFRDTAGPKPSDLLRALERGGADGENLVISAYIGVNPPSWKISTTAGHGRRLSLCCALCNV